jgi:hypothetical protein
MKKFTITYEGFKYEFEDLKFTIETYKELVQNASGELSKQYYQGILNELNKVNK